PAGARDGPRSPLHGRQRRRPSRLRPPVRILLTGLSARAIAESAVRAGCDIVTADYFGDVDTKRLGPNTSLRERGSGYSAAALAQLARSEERRGGKEWRSGRAAGGGR